MKRDSKACIACAERIKKDALLCRHCNTRQDDQAFVKRNAETDSQPDTIKAPPRSRKRLLWALVPAVGLVVAGAVVLGAQQPSPFSATTSFPDSKKLGNGVYAPMTNENSDHGYLLADDRIPKLDSCPQWDEFWIYEGPAVSFAAAAVHVDPEIAVSTEIYTKNRHLDTDLDGVICYLEYDRAEAKPVDPSDFELTEPWMVAAVDVREYADFENSEPHPVDFAASPSVDPEHSRIIAEGIDLAMRFWGPFIDTDRPLATTVVHPDDKDWFMDRWRELGQDNTGEFWWNLAKDGGGGAVGWTTEGVPNMYFMTSAAYPPQPEPLDYYIHEVAHFFQTTYLGTGGEASAPCWYGEGTANFIGWSMAFPDDLGRTFEHMMFFRTERAGVLMDFYDANGGLTVERLEKDVLNTPFATAGPTCQHEFPQFGYNLGAFVSEKLIIDHGFGAFIDMTKLMRELQLPEAFAEVTGIDYETWVRDDLFPYLMETIPSLG